MTPVQVCEALQSKYHVRSESDLEHVDHNVQYHWKNLQCSDKVTLAKATKAERLPDVPQTSLVDVINKASGKATASTTAPEPASTPASSGSEQELQLSAETEKQCRALALKHHVVPGRTWGTLTTEQQRLWTAMRCDVAPHPVAAVAGAGAGAAAGAEAGAGTGGSQEAKGSHASPSSAGTSTQAQGQGQGQGQKQGEGQGQGAGLETAVGLPQLSADSSEWCAKTKSKYHVLPMKSWGQLPFSLVDTWKARKCDLVFTSMRMRQNQVTKCGDPLPALSLAGFASGGKDSLPLIAIMAATTTRKVHQPSTQNLALFTMLLPSLIRSIDCGFRYVYVLGYDKGDPFYDDEANLQHIQKWFKTNIQSPMALNGVAITLKLVKVNNSLKKPGPVFIAMARAAYGLGADYFYRINDDTELMGHWPSIFVSAVKALPPPFGVVGPTCMQGNGQILTHDFVSRMHMEVFEMNYYPPVRDCPSFPLSPSLLSTHPHLLLLFPIAGAYGLVDGRLDQPSLRLEAHLQVKSGARDPPHRCSRTEISGRPFPRSPLRQPGAAGAATDSPLDASKQAARVRARAF